MKLIIKQTNNKTYAEIGQKNPIRWKTLFKEQDGSFTDQSGWIKCKDFYNDTVAFFREGSVFSIYSYDNKIKANEEGVYFLLKYINDKKSFFSGLDVVNKRLYKDFEANVTYHNHEGDEVVICIPMCLWQTTYRISLVTFLIRLCNYGYEYKTWEDFWNTSAPSYTMEQAFTDDAKKTALNWGFHVPPQFQKYWYYCSKEYNSEVKPKQTGLMIHNNGCSSWNFGMKVA